MNCRQARDKRKTEEFLAGKFYLAFRKSFAKERRGYAKKNLEKVNFFYLPRFQSGGLTFTMRNQPTPITGFLHYLIYSDGRIFNTRTGRFLHGSRNQHGYIYVKLRDLKLERNVCIHILVAEIFVLRGGPACTQVDHVNGDKSDNRSSNLDWVAPRENIHRAIRVGNHPASPLWQAKHKKCGPHHTTRHRGSGR